MLISVHTPKTSGTAIRRMLKEALGDRLMLDYAENPADPLSQRVLDPDRYRTRSQPIPVGIAGVHGHFHPGKYDLTNAFLFTMLREPLDNIISIYFFWQNFPRHDQLHGYVLDNQLSLLETARLPLLRRLYSETYFGGFDMGRFDLIGRYDQREKALGQLPSILVVRLMLQQGSMLLTMFRRQRDAVFSDHSLIRELEDILADDLRFYEKYAG